MSAAALRGGGGGGGGGGGEAALAAVDEAAAALAAAADELVSSGGSGASRARCLALLSRLRALHRAARPPPAAMSGDGGGEAAALRRQSLAYERRHLRLEAGACRQATRATDPEAAGLPAMPPAEALPAEERERAGGDPRRLRMARLAMELRERTRLHALAAERRRERDGAAADRAAKRRALGELGRRVGALYDGAVDAARALGRRPGAVDPPDPRAAAELPPPLYTLYHAALALSRDDEGVRAALAPAGAPPAVRLGVDGAALTFAMLPSREDAVAVRAAAPATSRALRHLYPDDGGDDLAPAGHDAARLGAPYLWCQRACGLRHAHPRRRDAVSNAAPTAASLVRRVRARLAARASLAAEVVELRARRLEARPAAGAAGAAAALGVAFKQLDAVTLQAFEIAQNKTRPGTAPVPARWWMRGADCYRAVFSASPPGAAAAVDMHVFVAVPAEYPARPPVCRVLLTRTAPALKKTPLLERASNPEALAAALASTNYGFNAHASQIERAANTAGGDVTLTAALQLCREGLHAYSAGATPAGATLEGRDRRLALAQ